MPKKIDTDQTQKTSKVIKKSKKNTFRLSGPFGWFVLAVLVCILVGFVYSNPFFQQYLPHSANNQYYDDTYPSSRFHSTSILTQLEALIPLIITICVILITVMIFAIMLDVGDMRSDIKDIADKAYKDNKD